MPPLLNMTFQSPASIQTTSVPSGKNSDSRSSPSTDGRTSFFHFVPRPHPLVTGRSLDEMSDEDHLYWLYNLKKCNKLQFLAHGFGGYETFAPDKQRLRLQMERFLELEQLYTGKLCGLSSAAYTTTSSSVILPPRSICDILITAYTNTFETVLRILHVPTFRREYENFWCQPLIFSDIETEDPFLCKLVVILALGSTLIVHSSGTFDLSSTTGAGELGNLSQQSVLWISYGKHWLARHIANAQRTDINMAQVLCLLALVYQVHDDTERPKGSVVHLGDFDLARMGMQMAFHRDPLTLAPAAPMKQVEMHRRLWATMVELTLQRGLDEGLPSLLSAGSFDCEPPSEISDEELESDLILADTSSKLEVLTRSTILVLLSRTQQLRLQCLQLINSPKASKSFFDNHSLASELNSIHNANVKILRGMDTRPSEFQVHLFQIYTWEFIRALHEPFAEQATSNCLFYYSRKVRIEAAMQTLTWPPSLSLGTITEQGPQADVAYGQADACMLLRVHGQGYLGRVQRKATVTLCVDLISDLENGTFRFSDTLSWKAMRSIICGTISVYERRLEVSSGTHGRRELLFLKAAEAYINALAGNMILEDVDEEIFQAIYNTISRCSEFIGKTQIASGQD
ncbi:hypothetical protein ACKAV7_012012 [Fusarium commune]